MAVIDATTGRVIGLEGDPAAATAGSGRAEELKANVERLLEARVGPGNAVVEVSVETVTESESIRERRIDPESRVAISTDVQETAGSETNSGGTGVTVASNLPDGAAGSGNGNSQSQNSESRALTNFDLSETTREVERKPGAIKRLSVAVLLNASRAGAGGAASDPAEIADMRELVASAVGFDESRGDRITVKSMAFEPRPELGTVATRGLFDSLHLDPLRLLQIGVLALVALALGLFVVRPVLRGSARAGNELDQYPLIDGRSGEMLTAEADGTAGVASIADARSGTAEDGTLPALANPAPATNSAGNRLELADAPVENLKRLIEERQPDTIEILRAWLEDDSIEETA